MNLLEMRVRVGYKCDIDMNSTPDIPAQGASDQRFITAEKVNAWLNEGMRLVYGRMAELGAETLIVEGSGTYTAESRNLSLQTILSITVDPYKIGNVADITNNTSGAGMPLQYEPYQLFRERRLNADSLVTRSSDRYWSYGQNNPMVLYIWPRPSSDLTLRIAFIPDEPIAPAVTGSATELTNTTDVPSFIPGVHHDMLVDYACVQAKKSEEDPSWKDDDLTFREKLDSFIQGIEERQQQSSRMVNVTDSTEYADGSTSAWYY